MNSPLALVTGATSGIGLHTAQQLASAGWRVLLCARDASKGARLAASTGAGAAYRSSKTALNAITLFYPHALAADRIKVNALAPGLRATHLNAQAAAAGGDPAEAAAVIRLAQLPDDGPTGKLFSWDGTLAPW